MKEISTTSLKKSYKYIQERSLLDFDYFLLLILSSILCFLGFKMNSVPVIIGSMVISPLLYSVIGIPTSIFFFDMKQLVKELSSLFLEMFLILLIIFIFGRVFKVEMSSEITSRISSSNIDYFLIALFSGIAGTLYLFWPKLQKSLVGIAISVALIPPLVLCGIGLAEFDITIIESSVKIVLINLLGIGIGSLLLLVFLKGKKKK